MICPYCQHELDVDCPTCPRCGAEYERRGGPFGVGLRVVLASGLMLMLSTLILVDCVLNYLPGGADSPFPATAAQAVMHQQPDFRSPDVQRTIDRWEQHEQAVGGLPQFNAKH